MRYFPLADRKHRLREVVPHEAERILYCDHIEQRGKHLFRLVCKRDLEGIVAKRKFDPYLLDNAKWYKIRNRNYSQWIGRKKTIRAGNLYRSQLPLLERMCISM